MTESQTNPSDSTQSDRTMRRRGLMAAAWAAVTGLVLARATEPVQAAASLQYGNLVTDAPADNVALGPTVLRSVAGFNGSSAVFTAQVQQPGSLAGLQGVFGLRPGPPMRCGVHGVNETAVSSPTSAGVLGQNYSINPGVLGWSGGDGLGAGIGVQGQSGSGTGVHGLIPGTSSSNAIALYGQNDSTYVGPATGAGGFGVYGSSARGHGLVGATGTAGGAAIVGATNSIAGAYAGAFYGPVVVTGDFAVFGTKSAAVPHPDGSRRLVYCMESPDSWFEDFGKATLECGRAQVTIDPDFAAIVDLDDYHVFTTAYDADCFLSVKQRTHTSFVVEASAREHEDRSALRAEISWRIVAKRKDVETKRFTPVRMPSEPVLPTLSPDIRA